MRVETSNKRREGGRDGGKGWRLGRDSGRLRDLVYLSICVQKTSDIAFPSFPHMSAHPLSGGVLNRPLSLGTPHLKEGQTYSYDRFL